MINFFVEEFSENEKSILTPYFTNTDKPVFGIINLPDVVKGALFARYSRSNKSLRRLFLDEFYTLDFYEKNNLEFNQSKVGVGKAIELYDRMFLQYGDDSVAQLGGAHIACEQVSNILAKIIERSRLAAYLEQSTRYVLYNDKINGKFKYYTSPEIESSASLETYENYINSLFETYTTIVEELTPKLKVKFPRAIDQSERAWANTLKAKACDIVRGLLPASTRTNLGIYANGQTYEYLLIKMFASKNEEVRAYAKMILEELKKIIPSFLERVDKEDRGVIWSDYLSNIESDMNNNFNFEFEKSISLNNIHEVNLLEWDKNAINKVVLDALFEYTETSQQILKRYVESLSNDEKVKIIKAYFGDRKNRRHKPGRAIENIFYKFEIVSDYGAFRDIQRHRMLTIQWQKISPNNGYVVPEELNEFPELRSRFVTAVENAITVYNKLKESVGPEVAQYSIPFAFKIRYIINMNLREAFHLLELRTQKQGHPSYRNVCKKMFELIKTKAGHEILADAMKFIDISSYNLSRDDAERRVDIIAKNS
jgi:thymidylate synthase ThyX